MSKIPKDFINALISAEDDEFYEHNGVSLKGLVRAASQLILTGRKGSGGSTLTMQLTRHIFLSLKRTYSRKFNEILLALRIEKELSKAEILELYVNYMFLGKRAYGIEAAAEVYYGMSIGELSLAQQAMLVGVFKGPSTLNPNQQPKESPGTSRLCIAANAETKTYRSRALRSGSCRACNSYLPRLQKGN